MKKSALLVFSLFIFSDIFSQAILTYMNNALLPGDTLSTLDIEMISPGNAGPDQVWDFSKIQLTGEQKESYLSVKSDKPIKGLDIFNATLKDKDYEYFYSLDEHKSEVVGLTVKDLSIVFSDPILKMKYPVLYGTNFTDEFTGNGFDKNKSGISVSGVYSFNADAFGTLILHDMIIKDVLRVKIEENKIQLNPCTIYEIKTTTYFWYSPAARYPILGISTRELKTSGKEAVVTSTAFINPEMCKQGILLAGNSQYGINTDEVALILYPNPFISKLNYNYFLRKQMPVTLELVDMTGKTIVCLTNDQLQPEGFHTGELDAARYDLKMGVYYFRFKFGDKVLVSKVVKM